MSSCREIYEQTAVVIDSTASARIEAIRGLTPTDVDAFLRLQGIARGSLALDWRELRKGYSLVLWIRPSSTPDAVVDVEPSAPEAERLLYRFATSPHNHGAIGVTVTVNDWTYSLDGSTISTTLTALSLPINAGMQLVQVPLTLKVGVWQCLAISHVFPYLKRPMWSVCLDGFVLGTGDLHYPHTSVPVLEHCTLLQNVTLGGASTTTLAQIVPHDQVPASELLKSPTTSGSRTAFTLDVASITLYPVALSPAHVAIMTHAGCCSTTVPILPPVANRFKGASLEGGPKVGIPLSVHPQALQVQQIATSAVFHVAFLDARLLGENDTTTRVAVPLVTNCIGSAESSPRVGLWQPAPPFRMNEDDVPTLYWTGKLQLVTAITQSHPNFSPSRLLLLLEQNVMNVLVLPFFLSLLPPAKLTDRHELLYNESLQHLHALYSDNGALAAVLIESLAKFISIGGARVHEEVLQNGILHSLVSSLRLSLLRANRVQFFSDPTTLSELQRRFKNRRFQEDTIAPTAVAPKHIPLPIVAALVELLQACCGPPAPRMIRLTPANRVTRTSDLALTAVFGMALDADLWQADAVAGAIMIEAVAERYGGTDSTLGYVVRSQVSVQFFLDTIRIRYEGSSDFAEVERAGRGASQLLTAMLLASLSNRRSISQGEHDISACMNALSDCPLGSLGAHVVLESLVAVLVWCEVLPMEASSFEVDHETDDQSKMQVASRLGRNLLTAQFHDVMAPMLLSRTVFAADLPKHRSGALSWSNHWRLSLLLFSWEASIAGPEGAIAAKATGGLLLASGLAGSLTGAMDDAAKPVISALYLPPPGMALMIGSTLRTEWSYTDLLADRLQIMMPLLPGLVVCLLSFDSTTPMSQKSLSALADVLTSAGGAFHRVFGGVIHQTVGQRSQVKTRRDGSSESVRAAKSFAPHLLVVALILELKIRCLRSETGESTGAIPVYSPEVTKDKLKHIDLDSWVEVQSVSSESIINEIVVSLPSEGEESDTPTSLAVLESCERSVLNTAAGLISNAMNLGGAGAAISLWQSVLATLEDSIAHFYPTASTRDDWQNTLCDTLVARNLVFDVLTRLVAIVLIKALKRQEQWQVWNYEMSSAVAKVCLLIEEKQLLLSPRGPGTGDTRSLSADQVVLLSTMLEVMQYGRDATGWCQLALPTMANSVTESRGGLPSGNLSESSKLLLPVLQPSVRIVLSCFHHVPRHLLIERPGPRTDSIDAMESRTKSLFDAVFLELDYTLTAAIVGLSFSSARDLALGAMATLRKAAASYQNSQDSRAAQKCSALLCKVTEELRVRYEAERRLRENALFDAYEDERSGAAAEAMQGSNAVERLILGGNMIVNGEADGSEEITFGTDAPKDRKRDVSDDFILFHEPHVDSKVSRLGYAQYEGLGTTLEECKILTETVESSNAAESQIVMKLQPFLDAWDAMDQRDSADAELVEQFGAHLRIEDMTESKESPDRTPVPITSAETAADAMSAFFEFAAAEKNRLKEITLRFLPSHRHSRMAFAERACWSAYMEMFGSGEFWERGVPDGNRDIRARIPTTPCFPQFRRYIPKYLDHYTDQSRSQGATAEGSEVQLRRSSAVTGEIDAFTKSLLEAGNLEIIDITKKMEMAEDDEPDINLRQPGLSLDEDDLAALNDVVSDMDSRHETFGSEPNNGNASPEKRLTQEAPSSGDLALASTEDPIGPPESDFVPRGQHSITTSAFATPPDNASSSLSLLYSAAAAMIEQHMEDCLHVKSEGSRPCTLLLTATHLVLEYEGEPEGFFEGEILAAQEDADRQRMIKDAGEYKENSPEEIYQQRFDRRQREIAALRPKSMRWNLSEVSHVYLRRYRLRDSSLEIFFIPSGGTSIGGYGLFSPSSALFLDFGPGTEGGRRRDDAAFAIMQRSPPQAIKQWPDRNAQFLHDQLSRLTIGWVEGRITNFDYLLHLNMLSGRSYNDICQYPVFPWVLADYVSSEIPDLADRRSYRDLSKPVGALNPTRLDEFLERFRTFADPSIPPFMYGSHYSTSAGVVLHFLVRLHPFAGLHRQLQSGHFDVADRLFSSVPRTWSMCTGTSAAEVKELTPEFYCNGSFLRNTNGFKLGTSQDGDVLGDVALPPWAKGSPEKFIEVMRAALESDVCSDMLPDWIDLIFGRSQQGPESIKANNVFFYLTYYGSVDVASIKDESLRQATELQIAHFGQCPMQLFKRPHVPRIARDFHHFSFYQVLSQYHQIIKQKDLDADRSLTAVSASPRRSPFGEPVFLPFFNAPMSHWVHLSAPPPGPHADLIAVRFAGTDRCLSVDARGIFHTFRWSWRPDGDDPGSAAQSHFDLGCFVAQRELPRFKSVPRLMLTDTRDIKPAVAISKTLFAGRSVLLVLSDGDGKGGVGMQLVDPSKGQIRGENMVPAVHSGRVTCIATDPIGTAAGHGGVGGELALFGSSDGSASLWRFMSSHYLPLRPRVRFRGHHGIGISAVAICSTSQIAVTLSTDRCCLHSIGSGSLIRQFGPPVDATLMTGSSVDTPMVTKFAETPALAISSQGMIITVCESIIETAPGAEQTVATLHLFTVEGISLGSKPLEKWRGLPFKMTCTPDGTAVIVCSGRGITIHRLSACEPLEIIDEWQITEADTLGTVESMDAAFDVDLGPSLNRPVVAAAACSNGALRLHALPGISAWSERYRKAGLSHTVGSALAKPAQRFNRVVRDGLGLGRQLAGMGRDIGREVSSDVKERGVSGFIGGFMARKSSSGS